MKLASFAHGEKMTDTTEILNRIHSLANVIVQRQREEMPPYVLLLGAGASVTSGTKLTLEIIDAVVRKHTSLDPSALSFDKKRAAFESVLDGKSEKERYAMLAGYLRGRSPSAGYKHLAELVKADYFRKILTTNFDILLESSFTDVGIRLDDFVVLINEQDAKERIVKVWKANIPRVKLLKLHGDIVVNILAFKSEELARMPTGIESELRETLDEDLLVVGHSLHDPDLDQGIKEGKGSLWYVNPSAPSETDSARSILNKRSARDHMILGELGHFDQFFAWLRLELALSDSEASVIPEVQDLIAELNIYRKRAELTNLAIGYEKFAGFYHANGQLERTEMCFDRSASLLEIIDDRKGAARLRLKLGNFHAELQRAEPALLSYRRARDLAKAAGDEHGYAQALMAIGRWYWKARYSVRLKRVHKERVQKAISIWEQCLPSLQRYDPAETRAVKQWLIEARELLRSL
jgi:hypothetical protein